MKPPVQPPGDGPTEAKDTQTTMGAVNVTSSSRTALVVAHTGRKDSVRSARLVVERLIAAGINVRVLVPEAIDIDCAGVQEVAPGPHAAEGAEIVIVVGGDGTLLRAAELARPARAPLLGVNLGHVGFLAEAEPDGLDDTVDRIVATAFRGRGTDDGRRHGACRTAPRSRRRGR